MNDIELIKTEIKLLDEQHSNYVKIFKGKKDELNKQLLSLLRNKYPIVFGIKAKSSSSNSFYNTSSHMVCYFTKKERAEELLEKYGYTSSSGNLTWDYSLVILPSEKIPDSYLLKIDEIPKDFPYND